MHILITHVYIYQKQVVLRKKMAFVITYKNRQTQVLSDDAMATTIIID